MTVEMFRDISGLTLLAVLLFMVVRFGLKEYGKHLEWKRLNVDEPRAEAELEAYKIQMESVRVHAESNKKMTEILGRMGMSMTATEETVGHLLIIGEGTKQDAATSRGVYRLVAEAMKIDAMAHEDGDRRAKLLEIAGKIDGIADEGSKVFRALTQDQIDADKRKRGMP
jgi:hypothetical protein